ncbi:MAG: Na+/H+ antiporter NhaA [Balneolaceae bacterium]|nr:Na+/H+ antiporter NhaA [Balneolaceae bacterium]MBO6546779.1 Na+/H+ antiporter NhaA [Balneolaceae bacterium]MBO6649139.1 Na+/H+ antiporter NhaA [Balneolaceae bacterium]
MNNSSSSTPLSPMMEFIKAESFSGILLMVSAILALIVANSPLSDWYIQLFEMKFTVGFDGADISKPLILWINDGLMAVFFLLIGLEIKREVKFGELSTLQSALLPVIAAFGGALIPGLIFFGFNAGTEFMDGWAVAIATDIAFAIGVLALLGSRAPLWAKVFLTAVAVVDDLIAVLVIALFYTSKISMMALGVSAITLIILITLNLSNVRSIAVYIIFGIILWVAVLKSGIHATIAGVLLGFLVPATSPRDREKVLEEIEDGVDMLREAEETPDEEDEETAMHILEESIEQLESPLHKLEHKLHPWVAYFIMPVFAFANAGVALSAEQTMAAFSSTLTLGILFGLFIGKQVGIMLSVWISHKLGFVQLPKDKNVWTIFYGISCLTGIGFTMSLFIGGLAFTDPQFIEYSKVGIFVGSLLSGLLGYFFLKFKLKEE